MEVDKQKYDEYVKEVTPVHSLAKNMACAFLVGGLICCLGQLLMTIMTNNMGMDKETAGSWTSLELILLSVVLTGLNIYQRIVKFGGAGALVPITGFANSGAAPAVEFHAEGEVFGVGCKIFTIAGPVILYGVLASWVLGILYWAGTALGLVAA